jgi:hypothetical protein
MANNMAISTLWISLVARGSKCSDSKFETSEKPREKGLPTKASDIITHPGTESQIGDLLNVKKNF